VAATDSFAGVAATLSVVVEPLLATVQQVAAGTTIRVATIVSQQAARRYTSRPQLS